MAEPILTVERISKRYRLGAIGMTTLRETVERWRSREPEALAESAGDSTRSGELWALRDVSFEVAQGEVMGIIGRNGAGKSTLLKILSRITEPTSGRAVVRGRVSSLLEVGTGFHPELTGRENIFLNGAILGMRKAEIAARFDEIVAFSELERFLDTPVKRYSSGMYVRLAFAVAAHLEPEILLVDEVLAVGDAAFQRRCLGKMGEVARAGRTVLFVSHSMPSICNLCGRAVLLTGGELQLQGTASGVVQQYLESLGTSEAEVMWPDTEAAPGNTSVRLRAVRIVQGGKKTANVDISGDVMVEIEYWCREPGMSFYASIWLLDKAGTEVLASGNQTGISLTTDDWYGRPYPKGLFRSSCCIPGNFLNEGAYSISVFVGRAPAEMLVRRDSVVTFRVHDTGAMRQEYYGHWLGVVRPRLAWRTEKMEGGLA